MDNKSNKHINMKNPFSIYKLFVTIALITIGHNVYGVEYPDYVTKAYPGIMPPEWVGINPEGCTERGVIYDRGYWDDNDNEYSFVWAVNQDAGERLIFADYTDMGCKFERLPADGLEAVDQWGFPEFRKVAGWERTYDEGDIRNWIYDNIDDMYEAEDGFSEPENTWGEGCNVVKYMRLGKFFDFPTDYSVICQFHHLEEYDVDPESEIYSSVDGALFSKNPTMLCSFPMKKNLPNDYKWPENLARLLGYSLYNINSLEELYFGPRVTDIHGRAIIGNKNLKKVTFEGDLRFHRILYYSRAPFKKNPVFRTIVLPGCDSIGIALFNTNPLLTDVQLSDKIRVLKGEALKSSRPMILRLPEIETIGANALGSPQIVELGTEAPKSIDHRWLDLTLSECDLPVNPRIKRSVILVSHSDIPPYINADERQTDPSGTWTVYVPEKAIAAYSNDRYWGKYWHVEAISDQIIPVISEPSLAIEEGESHEFIYDVFKMGDTMNREITNVEWESDNISSVTIDQNGTMTAEAPGTANVILTLTDNLGYSHTKKAEVTVVPKGTLEEWVGVKDIKDDSHLSRASGVYNINGQRISDSIGALSPGLYIIHDKGVARKIIVK